MIDPFTISRKIDHTLLKPDADIDNIRQLCQEAIEHHFFSVCINSAWLKIAGEFLQDSSVKLCTVAGFPMGDSTTSSKLNEMETSINNGASEIDMVMNIGFFKNEKYNIVSDEIIRMVQNAHGKIIKIIINNTIWNNFFWV